MERILKNSKNYLLVKDDVGKAKPATRDLPPEGFCYGRPDKKDQEGAGLVTSSWKAHEQSKSKDADRDFKKLNKMGIKNGAIDAKVNLNNSSIYKKLIFN
jgi:hypothetical protein